MAAKLITHVCGLFNVELPLSAIFNTVSTVAGMAEAIDKLLAETDSQSQSAAVPAS